MSDGSRRPVTGQSAQRLVTIGVGLVCLVEAATRILLTMVLPTAVMLVVSHALPFAFLAILLPWVFRMMMKTWDADELPPLDDGRGIG